MESKKIQIQRKISEDTQKVVDKSLKAEKWKSFVSGKVTEELAALDVLDIDKKKISILSKAIGLSEATATTMVNGFYEERCL